MYYSLTFVLLCLSIIIQDGHSKGGGGRGGGSRGGSSGGSRGSSSGGSSSSRGGSSGGGWGGGGSRTFSRGSISSSTSRNIAAGVAGGVIGYQGAKVARRVSSSSSYFYYPTYHRTYYYGSRYYPSGQNEDQKCIYQIESGDDYFDLTYDNDGSRVTEILFTCDIGQECCDGLDCCNPSLAWWAIVLIIFACLIVPLCICMCVLRRRKRSEDSVIDNDPLSQQMEMNIANDNQKYAVNKTSEGPTFVSAQPQSDPSSTFIPNSAQVGLSNQNGQYTSGYPSHENQLYIMNPSPQGQYQSPLPSSPAFIPTHVQMGINNSNTFGSDYNQINADNNKLQPPPPYGILK